MGERSGSPRLRFHLRHGLNAPAAHKGRQTDRSCVHVRPRNPEPGGTRSPRNHGTTRNHREEERPLAGQGNPQRLELRGGDHRIDGAGTNKKCQMRAAIPERSAPAI